MKEKTHICGYYIAVNKDDKLQMCDACSMNGRDEKCSVLVRREESTVQT
jgi:hypothetical protein